MAGGKDSLSEGETLVKQQIISKDDLDDARKEEEKSGTPWYRQLLQQKKIGFDIVNDVLRHEFHPKALRQSHMSLGESLVKTKAITKDQLNEALAEQKRNGKLLGDVLLENGHVTRENIAQALAVQYGLEYVNANERPSDRSALDAVPESMARQKEFIPVQLDGDKLTVLVSGPQAQDRLNELGILLGMRIHGVMTAVDDIHAEIVSRYTGKTTKKSEASKTKTATKAPKKSSADSKPKSTAKKSASKQEDEVPQMTGDSKTEKARFDAVIQEAQGVPVIKLVSTIIEGAVNSGATDVHLDPQEPEMRVRYRIDGVLHDVMSIPDEIEQAVVSRIKIMADIDITETRHPQDGHIGMEIGKDEFDVRVATLPTFLGERVVLRLLDQSSVLSGVMDLGLESDDEKKLLRIIDQPYGMVLVTGPTGSGKTTTLYSCLNQKDVMTDSIVTLEDPVEYQLSGINQVQIETDIDLSFASVLRASLRQDIDVLLVGEIRDPETARIAIRAAMTGHLVFSTLHTNDAPEAITTLRNMGVPSYLISSALTAVIAQRLVRKICDNCNKPFAPTKTLLKSIGLPESTKKLRRGTGCDNCYHTGTKGRTGIFEVLEMTAGIRKLVDADESAEKITKAAKLKTMAERCRVKVKQGTVNPEEFLRVIRT